MIYVIGARPQGPLKIGRAKDPEQRLRELQTGSPERLKLFAQGQGVYVCHASNAHRDGTILEDAAFERFLHRTFSEARLHGEWFALDLEDILYYGGGAVGWSHDDGSRGDLEFAWENTAHTFAALDALANGAAN